MFTAGEMAAMVAISRGDDGETVSRAAPPRMAGAERRTPLRISPWGRRAEALRWNSFAPSEKAFRAENESNTGAP
jgi:hypothetical protein